MNVAMQHQSTATQNTKEKAADLKTSLRAASLENFGLRCRGLANFGLAALPSFWWHALDLLSHGYK